MSNRKCKNDHFFFLFLKQLSIYVLKSLYRVNCKIGCLANNAQDDDDNDRNDDNYDKTDH